jgi:hypothetical protein
LGYFVQNSINADPGKLGRTLRENPDLPFQDLKEATSSHLTVGPPPPKPCEGCIGIQAVQVEDAGGMEKWATIPVALLSVMIGSLLLLFLGRRVWKRRREVVDSDLHVQRVMQTNDFTVGDDDLEKEKMKLMVVEPVKKKKKKHKKKHHHDDTNESDSSATGSNPQVPSVDDERSVSSEDSEARRSRLRKERKSSRSTYSRRIVNDEHSVSSGSSEDTEARRRRRRKEKKSSRHVIDQEPSSRMASSRRTIDHSSRTESSRHNNSDAAPPTLADLNCSKSKRKSRRNID